MIALITGCGSGFGFELVEKFLKNGWTVIATLRKAEERKVLFAEQMKLYPERLYLVELDVTNTEQRKNLANFVATKFPGGIDCLINNAGTGYFGAISDFTEVQIRAQMETNFFSLTFLTRELLPQLILKKGRIINLSSALGFMGMPFSALYCASKFAVEGLTEGLYFELKSKDVQVALVEPGGFRTKFSANIQWAEKRFDAESIFAEESKNFEKLRDHLSSRPNPTPTAKVIDKIFNLAKMRSMPLRVQVGTDSVAFYFMKKILPERIYLLLYSRLIQSLIKKVATSRKGTHATASSL